MKPVVDIFEDVVAALKPTFDTSPDISGQVVRFTNVDKITHLLFVGERIKMKDGSNKYHYGTISSITDEYTFIVTFTDLSGHLVGNPEVVLNYHYGTDDEMIQRFAQITQIGSLKQEQFPLIYLFQPFKETVANDGYSREVSLNILILTDTQNEWSTPERYDYNYRTILYPLLDLLMQRISFSNSLSPEIETYDRTDQVSWGRHAVNEKPSIAFRDYVDGIEIENLKLKIFKT